MTIQNYPQNTCPELSLSHRFPVAVKSYITPPHSEEAPCFSSYASANSALVAADLMTPAEVAKVLSISVRTLAAWRSVRRSSLPWVRVGNQVRYRKSDIAAWLESQLQNNASQLAGGA